MKFSIEERLPVVIVVDPIKGGWKVWSAVSGNEFNVMEIKLWWESASKCVGFMKFTKEDKSISWVHIYVVPDFDERIVGPRSFYELQHGFFKSLC